MFYCFLSSLQTTNIFIADDLYCHFEQHVYTHQTMGEAYRQRKQPCILLTLNELQTGFKRCLFTMC